MAIKDDMRSWDLRVARYKRALKNPRLQAEERALVQGWLEEARDWLERLCLADTRGDTVATCAAAKCEESSKYLVHYNTEGHEGPGPDCDTFCTTHVKRYFAEQGCEVTSIRG